MDLMNFCSSMENHQKTQCEKHGGKGRFPPLLKPVLSVFETGCFIIEDEFRNGCTPNFIDPKTCVKIYELILKD